LESELTRVDVQGIKGDTDSGGDEFLDLSDLRAQSSSVVVPTASQLDVIAGVENSTDKARLDGGGCHTSDHDWGFAEETRKGGVEVEFTITVKRELRSEKQRR